MQMINIDYHPDKDEIKSNGDYPLSASSHALGVQDR
jgi:hypothetical protein